MKRVDCSDWIDQQKPDCQEILQGLKDFQRDTVDYVFSRLYTDADSTRRFLVADEVGLGKTLVARGIIAKAIEHLWRDVPRIDILYICSNSNIANQNIGKLNILKNESPFATRISLMPLKIKNLNNKKVNFIALTPGTSFEVSSGTGIGEERALLYLMLKDEWDLNSGKPLKVFQGGMSPVNFRNMIKNFDTEQIDSDLKESFLKLLRKQDKDKQKNSEDGLRARIQKLSSDFTEPGLTTKEKKELERKSNSCISELRRLLVKACLKALEPDLIILDEFQRFKHLVSSGEEDDAAASARELAQELFSYADKNSKARVLLLSATPYKMYTTYDEPGNDDHYQDFLDTFRFLVTDPKLPEQAERKVNECNKALKEFRDELFQIGQNDGSHMKDLKKTLESQLCKVMVRTEKLAASEDGNGMLKIVYGDSSDLEADDLLNYCAIQKVSELLDCGELIEYWKSSPYPLNFMDNYELKDAFREAVSRKHGEIYNYLSDANGLLLPWKDIGAYKQIDPENSRLRNLFSGTIGVNAWKLLWMPPSVQYYKLGEPFSDSSLKEFTKRLVFSSWRMVPRMISSLTSYEAERNIVRLFNPSFGMADAEKKIDPLLRLKSSEGGSGLGGMPILGMIYPSIELARHCDPLTMASRSLITSDHAVEIAQTRIEELLRPLTESSPQSGTDDDNWYWAAPILIDIHHHHSMKSLLCSKALREIWTGKDNVDEEKEDDRQTGLWMDAIEEVAALIDGETKLGRPPKDLSLILAKMAIAGPGTASLRALSRITGGLNMPLEDIWISAANMAFSFIRLFNRMTSNALLRGLYSSGSKENVAYWKHVLDYCLAGGLQMVLDEYVHFLKESEGIYGLDRNKASERISATVIEALGIRSATLKVDDIVCNAKSRSITLSSEKKMRMSFAVMLSDRESDASPSVNRISQVRKAFNSPFWPFVLATTSIGQEGLDFHAYCHAVVHWNLPSNPVDLEQREGRVHRFKGHAIRKNLALKYGLSEMKQNEYDPWEAIFTAGKRDRKVEDRDIVPYWISTNCEFKIQRHVPALPLSRDRIRMQDLKNSLAVYRMVFGQPRQEDLVEYLTKRLGKDAGKLNMDCLRIDLSPPRTKN